jgi:hypothetical protein
VFEVKKEKEALGNVFEVKKKKKNYELFIYKELKKPKSHRSIKGTKNKIRENNQIYMSKLHISKAKKNYTK